MTTKKLVGITVISYGLTYLLMPHELHVQGWAADWLLVKLGILNQGFPHYIHLILGALLSFYGVMLWTGKYKTPKFLAKLYGQKKKY